MTEEADQPVLAPARRRSLPALAVLLLALLCLGAVSQLLQQRYTQRLHDHFEADSARIAASIRWHMTAYTQILRGAAGLFAASQEVRRNEWQRYVEHLGLDEVYDGIQGVGFAQLIRPEQLDAHQQEIRSQGFPDYLVIPRGERPVYSSIVYLEPFSGRNLRAFGFDMFAEPVRRAAMERARDSGQVAISGKVRLMQESDTDVQAGVLAYYPVYANDALPRTPEQRSAALLGWVYSPYRMNDLVAGMIKEELRGLRLEIFDDGERLDSDALLYDSQAGSAAAGEAPEFASLERFEFGGRTWTLRFTSLPSFAARAAFAAPWAEFGAILLIGVLLSAIVWVLIGTQRRAERIATSMTASLRESREKFRTIFEQAAIGIAQFDPENRRFLRVNRRLCQLLGYSRSELERMNTFDISHPDDGRLAEEPLRELAERAVQQFSLEKRYLHKDGRTIWVNITASAVFDAQGRLDYYLGMFEDITPRKAYEAALQNSQRELREQRQRLANVIWGTDIGTWEWDVQSGETLFNERWAGMVGYTLAELEPLSIATWERLLNPEDAARCEEALQRCFRRETDLYECELRLRHKSGDWVWVLDRGRVVEWTADGKPLRMSGTHLDITARKHNEARLQLAASVFSHAREGIVITDARGCIIEVNAPFTRITGYSHDEAIGLSPEFFKSSRHAPEFYAAIGEALREQGYWSGEVWNRRKAGDLYLALLTISLVNDADGRVQNYVALFSDITLLKEQQQQLEHIAHHDALTHLPNRMLFADRLQQALAHCGRSGQPLAVIYLDLDGFKAVNDTYGHDVGDELLVIVSQRMKAALREIDTLARIGGDEFVAVLDGLEHADDCRIVLERLLKAAADPIVVGGAVLHVTASIGAALYPQDGDSAEQLVYRADQAMYQAKHSGKNRYCLFAGEVLAPAAG